MTIRLLWHNSRESILNAVSGIATDCSGTKAERATKLCNNAHMGKRGTDLSDLHQCEQRRKGSTDLSDLSLSRWLDDAAIQQGANRVSCQVTVVVVVTGIDVSSTLKYQKRPTSNHRCISTTPCKALQILITKMEVTKDANFTTVCPESFGETRCNGRAGERGVSAQYTQANRKESLRSHSSVGQKALGKPSALFSSEQGNLIRSSVFRNAGPSNLRGSLPEGNKGHLLNQARSDLAKQELHVESLNKCIGELRRQTEEQKLALQDAQYGFVESGREQVRFLEELIVHERKSSPKYAGNGRNEESARTTNR